MSVERVDSPRGTVDGGAMNGDALAARRIARWARGVLDGEADRFRFAISVRSISSSSHMILINGILRDTNLVG